jgi:hypothetical protein
MLLRLGDLDEPLNMEDRADRLSDRTWNVIAVVFFDLHDLRATRIARPSQMVLNAGSPVAALYLLKSKTEMSSAKYETGES